MNPPRNQVDQHGFPIPKKFDDGHPGDDRDDGPRQRFPWRKTVALLLLAAIVAALVVESPLGTDGRNMWIRFLVRRADEKHAAGDLPGAIAALDRAISWLPEDQSRDMASQLYTFRARWRFEDKQFDASLDDANRAVELQPKQARAYLIRSFIYQRDGEHEKALTDLDQAVRYREPADPEPLNARAYGCALARTKLKEGLADVERALVLWPMNYAYLDTRGYLQFLLGDKQAALDDLEKSIELGERSKKLEFDRAAKRGASPAYLERFTRQYDEQLSVLYHHRGEVFEKMGQADRATADFAKAKQLGYNPAEGVF
ncbi:MAG TPA: hypothetical protein VHZ24_11900 [Pirellulales bacterium]|jgi:tetratricopeptide (TPR) repeat protein|nr:hypothetical protein [Pirellulales bacterium]